MTKASLEKEIQDLENLVDTLQDAKSIDDSLKAYRKAVQKANGVLTRLAEAKLEVDTCRVSISE
jgi:exonuclease VII small subunit